MDKKTDFQGALILCGGGSQRMGRDKASLPFGPETMLQRVVRKVGEAVGRPIVVVAAKGQPLPRLPDHVQLAHDRQENRGPLEGLAVGLSRVGSQVDLVFATSCDVPLLVPAFVSQMFAALGEHEIAVVKEGNFRHPLVAVYRTSLLPRVESLLKANRRRLVDLLAESDTLEVPAEEMRPVDPQLASLENLNSREDYLVALRRAGCSEESAS